MVDGVKCEGKFVTFPRSASELIVAASQWPRIRCQRSTSSAIVLVWAVAYLWMELMHGVETTGLGGMVVIGETVTEEGSMGNLNKLSVGSK